MKQKEILKIVVLILILTQGSVFSQISTGNLEPNRYAQLDIVHSKRGILIPRVALQSQASPQPISSNALDLPISLLVFNTNVTTDLDRAYYYWSGTKWNKLIIKDDIDALSKTKSPWNKAGTTTTAELNTDNIYQMGSVGIGKQNNNSNIKLDVSTDVLINNLTIGKRNGDLNTAIGYQVLNSNTSGNYNTAIGYQVLNSNTSGNYNTTIGYQSSINVMGSYNVSLGSFTLTNGGSYNTIIGHNAGANLSSSHSNCIAIGWNANPTMSNTVRIGNDWISKIEGQVNFSASSDRRWKDEIKTIPLGLEFINKVRPVEYIRKNNEERTKEWGVIAQELQQTIAEEGYQGAGVVQDDNTPDHYLSVRYTDLIAPVIKAIQELSKENQELSKENGDLKKQNDLMEQRMTKLEELIKKTMK